MGEEGICPPLFMEESSEQGLIFRSTILKDYPGTLRRVIKREGFQGLKSNRFKVGILGEPWTFTNNLPQNNGEF